MIELIKAAFIAQITLAELSVNEELNKQIKIAEKWQQKKI
jgi:hypothetical protein